MPENLTKTRSVLVATVLLALLLAGWWLHGCTGGDERAPRPDAAPGAPNVIVIVLDDATAEMITPESMPTATRLLADRGTSFTNFIAVSPLCCPSRANLLSGQYGHNNGVLKNFYSALRKKSQILPRWLQAAGYKSLHVGKYMNGFTSSLDRPEEVPAGWDEWFTLISNGYFDYDVSDNGRVISYGSAPSDYVTRVINRKAAELVSQHAREERPFYLQVDHFAPHPRPTRTGQGCFRSAVPDPRDVASVRDLEIPQKRSRNEADVSDKPWFVQGLPRVDREKVRLAEVRFQCGAAALLAVDRGLKMLIEALRKAGELQQTTIMLTSDNGYFFAEHRIGLKKEWAYEENLRMPLLVRAPMLKGRRRREVGAVTGMIDIAPTILDLASADPCDSDGDCRLLDGRSMVPLLDGREGGWPGRTLLIELDEAPKGDQRRTRPCSWVGVRTREEVFVRYRTVASPGTSCLPTTAREYYDLATDPEQLQNLARERSEQARVRQLEQLTRRLEPCAGNITELPDDPNACE